MEKEKSELFLYLNIQSLNKHKNELEQLVYEKKPLVVVLSETRITEDFLSYEIDLIGYKSFVCYSNSRFTGGVIIYVSNLCKYENYFMLSECPNYWCVGVFIKCDVYTGYVMGMYHSPSSSDAEFLTYLNNLLESYIIDKNIIIIGDFNINVQINSFYSMKLIQLMESYGFKQYIHEATRITQNSRTIIDLVFSNIEVSTEIANVNISDHLGIEIWWNHICRNNKSEKEVITYDKRDYNSFNQDIFDRELNNQLETLNKDENLNVITNNFVNTILKTLDKNAPLVKVEKAVEWIGKEWFDTETREMCKQKNQMFKKAITSNLDDEWVLYKDMRNKTSITIKNKKKSYIQNKIVQNKYSPKHQWKFLKQIVKGFHIETCNLNIQFDNVDDTNNLATKFNKYFINSIYLLVESFDHTQLDNAELYNENEKWVTSVFDKFKNINCDKLNKILQSLPNKNDIYYNVPIEIIKKSKNIIDNTLTLIINKSLDNGLVPDNWKISTIIPIEKVQNTKKASDFRPINTLPIFEKTLEIVVKEQLVQYLDNNKILIDEQSGFRRKHSCETAIQLVLNDWKTSIDNRKLVGILFLDLKRAFETIDRNILLIKLSKYGISGVVLKWFKSYLTNRKQRVKYNKEFSDEINIDYGVPQGSVLGPILFIIYINDLLRYLKSICPDFEFKLHIFADDTIIYVEGDNIDNIQDRLQRLLLLTEKWMLINRLIFNLIKTKIMLLRSSHKIINSQISIISNNGTVIDEVEEIKYLGVLIDNKLNFNKHIDYMVRKSGKKISYFNRLGKYLNSYTKMTLYKSLIAPHFEYCSTVLITANRGQIDKLQIQQNRAMRFILGCDKYTSIRLMLDTLNFLSIEQRVHLNVLTFIFKILNHLTPNYLFDVICPLLNLDNSRRTTRQLTDIQPRFCKTTSAQKSLFYFGVQMYNKLPVKIKQSDTIAKFKREVCKHVKNELT